MRHRTSSTSLRLFVCLLVAFVFCALCSMPLIGATPGSTPGASPASGPQTGPKIWLADSQILPVNPQGGAGMAAPLTSGQAQPLAMTSADLDGDGIADLVVGYSTPNGGTIAVYRGNLDAFAPQSDASFQAIGRGEFPSPFLPDATVFSVPVSPAFLATGDFTGNGHKDIAFAANGAKSLFILPGDGKGNFGAAITVTVPGGITAMAAGTLGRTPTLIVGGSRALTVYVPTAMGLTALASYPTAGPVSNILFGDFGDPGPDVAFLSGGKVQILRSAAMQVTTVSLPATVKAFDLGSFIYDRIPGTQIAFVASDGSVQIAAHNEFDPRQYSAAEWQTIRRGVKARTEANPLLPLKSFPVNGWKVVESFPGVASLGSGQTPVFFRTRVSSNGNDDLMLLNAGSGQLALISHPDVPAGGGTFLPGQISLRPYTGSPIAALPLRLNVDGRPGVMAIHPGQIAPSMMMPLPDPTFTVNTTADLVSADPNACLNNVAGQCSLREAIIEANATAGTDTIMIPAGTYTLTIPRNAADHSSSKTGTLEVQDSVNIVGAGQATTIIQGGALANLSDSIDKVISFNQDIDSFTNADVSVSNLTFQNGNNKGDAFVLQDGYGGIFDFDTGATGTHTLTMTNVTINNGKVSDGQGGGFTIFNTNNGSGSATFTNCIVQNNNSFPSAADSLGDGGGIVIDARSKIVLNNVQVINNTAHSNAGINATGGGMFFQGQHTQPQSHISGSTISGNTAAGIGGGMNTIATLLIDGGTVISNNNAGKDGNNFGGGGIRNDSFDGLSLSKVAITGNTTTGNGGAIFTGDGSGNNPVTITFSRLAGNTSILNPGGNNIFNFTGVSPGNQVTAQNNWWGTNNPASTIVSPSTACPAVAPANSVCFDPFIVLTHTAAPNLIRIGDPSNLTADFLHDNHGSTIAPTKLDVFAGLPVTFDNANHGTISNAQPFIESRVNISSVSETGCSSPPLVPCTATVTVATTTPHGFSVGQNVTIAGVTDFTYDGVFAIASTPTTTTFTYSTNNTNTTSSSGGTASVPAGTATALYTATSGGIDNVHATVDGVAATATITVLFPPSIAKDFNKTAIPVFTFSPVVATLTFTITNPNTANALNGLAFTDNLPSGLAVANVPNVSNACGGTVTATAGSGVITLSGGTVTFNAGGTATCTVSVDVKGLADGVQNNTSGNVTATDAGGLGGNFATASITVINPPSIAKVFGAAKIPLNGTTSLTFTLSSSNVNLPLSGVTFTDSLPAGLVVATPNGLTNTCSTTPTAVAGSSSVSLTGASLAPGTSCTVSVNVTGTIAGLLTNSVFASDTVAGTGNTSTAPITVASPPTITKTFGAASIPLNGSTSLTFNIANPNGTSLSGIVFNDTLPAGLIISTPNGFTSTCTGTITAAAGTNSISLTGSSLAAGASCAFAVNVTGTGAGHQVNTTGAISSTEGGTGATASASVDVVAPPSIAKAFNPNGIPVNGTSTLTFTITNPAANSVAEAGVAFTDNLPAGVVVATPNGLANSCGGTATATAGSGTISLTGGAIAVNTNCTLSVNVTSSQAGVYTNTSGNVSSTNGGTGNTASDTLSVASPPTIAKAFAATSVAQNSTVGVSFTISNSNTSVTLTGISFTDNLPAGLVVANPNQATTTCGGTVTAVSGSSSISFTGGALDPAGPGPMATRPRTITRRSITATSNAQGSCVVTVNLLVTGTGTLANTTGPVSANESGPGNVSNTATLEVVQPPTANKAFGAASIPLNGTTSLTFNIADPNGSTPLVDITLSDNLPSGLLVANPNGLTGSCVGSSTITANAGSGSVGLTNLNLPASGSCSFSVNVTGTTASTKNNTSGNITATFDDGSGTFRPITGGTASASLVVVAPPSIAKAFVPATIAPNGVSSLTFTITNPAANTGAETGVAFADTLPSGIVVATPNNVSGSCNGGTVTAVSGSGSISLTGGTIAAASTCVVSVDVTGSTPGSFTNTTGAVSSTNGGTGNTATAVLNIKNAALSITKTHQGQFHRGQNGAQYTITVSNSASAGPTVGTVTVVDTIPNIQNTIQPTGLTGTGWTCTLSTLTCTRSDVLAPGASYPAITLTVNIPINIQNNFTNQATVSGGGDPNSHTASDPVSLGPPILITSTDGGTASVTSGNPATFNFMLDSTAVSPQPPVVSFTCTGLPGGSACLFSPLATGQNITPFTMTVTTLPHSSSLMPSMKRKGPLYATVLFPIFGVLVISVGRSRNRKKWLRLGLVFGGMIVMLALAGCGGAPNGIQTFTNKGIYTITVTGTAATSTGTAQGSATVTLTVH